MNKNSMQQLVERKCMHVLCYRCCYGFIVRWYLLWKLGRVVRIVNKAENGQLRRFGRLGEQVADWLPCRPLPSHFSPPLSPCSPSLPPAFPLFSPSLLFPFLSLEVDPLNTAKGAEGALSALPTDSRQSPSGNWILALQSELAPNLLIFLRINWPLCMHFF